MSTFDLDILRRLTEEDVRDMLFRKIYGRAEAYYHCRSCMLAAKAIADGEHLTPLEKTNSG